MSTAPTRSAAIQQARAHVPHAVPRGHAERAVHGAGALGRLNSRIAVRITNAVGSMWCAYAFGALALVSLPAAIRSHDPVILVAWLSQTFLQLVLLSVIIVGQNVQAAATDARAEMDHETLQAVHTLSVEIHAMSEQQGAILQRLDGRG